MKVVENSVDQQIVRPRQMEASVLGIDFRVEVAQEIQRLVVGHLGIPEMGLLAAMETVSLVVHIPDSDFEIHYFLTDNVVVDSPQSNVDLHYLKNQDIVFLHQMVVDFDSFITSSF